MLFSSHITKQMNASYWERRGIDTPTEKLESYTFALKDNSKFPPSSVYHCLIQPTLLPASVSDGYIIVSDREQYTAFNIGSLGIKVGVNTYPCPIFSYLVYFFLGSPMLTIVPKKNNQKKSILLSPFSRAGLAKIPPRVHQLK